MVPDEIKGVRKLVFLKFLETTSPLKQSDGELIVAIVAILCVKLITAPGIKSLFYIPIT